MTLETAMAQPRLVMRPSLLVVVQLYMLILSTSSQDLGDETPQSLTINHLTMPGESVPAEVMIDQDEVVEYRPPSSQPPQHQPFYRPFIPFNRYWQPMQHTGIQATASYDSLHPPNTTQRKKKDCGFPVLTRRLFGPVMKRSLHYFANSEEEVQAKIKQEDKDLDNSEAHARSARSAEIHSGGCMAKRQWIDMGSDYYPRYVKSYHCSSNTCDKGFGNLGECKAKHYTTKVLKRITTADSTSVKDCDQTLPEDLRVAWKLISVTVTTCCDCISPSRMFGLQ